MAPGRSTATAASANLLPFSRKEFYDLAITCRTYATELADRDQRHVYVAECRRMNAWLQQLKRTERLGPHLADIQPARPVARWQVATLTGVIWLLIYLYASSRGAQITAALLLNSTILLMLVFYMLPERLFGTTIEELEGKLLRVVEVLEAMLAAGEMGLSQAAYFRARDNLAAAHAELRQQIDLAHRE